MHNRQRHAGLATVRWFVPGAARITEARTIRTAAGSRIAAALMNSGLTTLTGTACFIP